MANTTTAPMLDWATRAVEVANTRYQTPADLPTGWPDANPEEVAQFARTAEGLRRAIEAAVSGDSAASIAALNALLARLHARPRLALGPQMQWQVRLTARGGADYLANAVWALVQWLCPHGPAGLGACHASTCSRFFLQGGTRRHRRFCGDRCATRTHVAAHRSRRAQMVALARV